MIKKAFSLLFLPLLIPLLSSCDPKETATGKTAPEESKVATKRGNQNALATVGDQVITVDRFKFEFSKSGKPDSPESRKQVLDELIDRLKMVQFAREKKLDEDPEFIRKVEDLLIARVQSQEVSSATSKRLNLDTDAVRDYYDQHPEEFTTPARARISLIFVSAGAADREEKRTRIEKAKAEIEAANLGPDQNFGDIATRYSEDTRTRTRGGDGGYILEGMESRSLQPAEVFAAAFKMQNKGEISDIIETEDGFYLVKVTDRADASVRHFDSVKSAIRTRLAASSRDSIKHDIQARVNSLFEAETDEELLKSIVLDVPAPGQPIRQEIERKRR